MSILLSTRGLGKSFPTASGIVRVMKDVNMDLSQGSFTLLTGPSGAGKTTFLYMIGFLTKPTEGIIQFDGKEIDSADKKTHTKLRRNQIGFVFQHSALMPKQTVLQNVMFRNRYRNRSRQETSKEALLALSKVGLEDMIDRKAEVLSGGEAQRTALARALMGRPRLLLADEPSGNLDERNAVRIVNLLSEAVEAGTTVVMVTHNPVWSERAHETFQFQNGKLERTK